MQNRNNYRAIKNCSNSKQCRKVATKNARGVGAITSCIGVYRN